MTAWETERAAVLNMIEKFGGENQVFSVVMDSYDYENALNNVLPSVRNELLAKGGTMVLRPDSGDPVDCVIQALQAGERTFGASTNSKGFKVVPAVAVIQGDGINYHTVKAILDAAHQQKFSAQNIGSCCFPYPNVCLTPLTFYCSIWHGWRSFTARESRYHVLRNQIVFYSICG